MFDAKKKRKTPLRNPRTGNLSKLIIASHEVFNIGVRIYCGAAQIRTDSLPYKILIPVFRHF